VKHFKSIKEYCNAIGIPPSKQPYFDIRRFEENMPTVLAKMEPFKHEFYAIAVRIEGTGKVTSGHYNNFPEGATIFFNIPFQILSWNIIPDWKGYYIMFSKEFIIQSKHLQQLLSEFPFLKMDKSIPFTISPEEASKLISIYQSIHDENSTLKNDSSRVIEAQVLVMLNYINRFFNAQTDKDDALAAFRKADINLLSRFQSLLETSFYNSSSISNKTHSPRFYAEQIAVHPNHLNAVVKQITGHTAKTHINNHLLRLAKSRLLQTDMSIKEIAYSLHFDAPNNFSSFFKKLTSQTPNSFKKSNNL